MEILDYPNDKHQYSYKWLDPRVSLLDSSRAINKLMKPMTPSD